MAEKRFYPIDKYELRVEPGEGDTPGTLVGMAPPYNIWSPIRGGMRERFLPNAFEGSERDVIATVEHDNSKILGRASAGTLKIEDKADGAHYRVTLGSRSYERDLAESIDRGDIQGSSFEFLTVTDRWEEDGEGLMSRTVVKAIRQQVGPVASPFYDDTTAAMRSLDEWKKDHEAADEEAANAARAREREIELALAEPLGYNR